MARKPAPLTFEKRRLDQGTIGIKRPVAGGRPKHIYTLNDVRHIWDKKYLPKDLVDMLQPEELEYLLQFIAEVRKRSRVEEHGEAFENASGLFHDIAEGLSQRWDSLVKSADVPGSQAWRAREMFHGIDRIERELAERGMKREDVFDDYEMRRSPIEQIRDDYKRLDEVSDKVYKELDLMKRGRARELREKADMWDSLHEAFRANPEFRRVLEKTGIKIPFPYFSAALRKEADGYLDD